MNGLVRRPPLVTLQRQSGSLNCPGAARLSRDKAARQSLYKQFIDEASKLSKQIAGDIGIAEATVKVHRSRAMRKMGVRSLPELGRMADKLKLVADKP